MKTQKPIPARKNVNHREFKVKFLAKQFVLGAVLALELGLTISSASAAVDVWDGNGTNANWSDAANWAAGVVPANNDSLVFNGLTSQNNTNDLNNLAVGTVTFNNGGFVLNGNVLTVNGVAPDFFTNSAGTNIIACPLITGPTPGGKYWFVARNSELRLAGPVTNTAASGTSVGWLNLTNGGTVRIMNTATSSRGMDFFQGTIIIDGGYAVATNDGYCLKAPTNSMAELQITNNGSLLIGGGGNFRLGNNRTGIGAPGSANGTNRVDMSSGLVNLYGPSVSLYVGDNVVGAVAIFNQNGGLVWGSAGGSNTLTIGNTNGVSGTYNLNGGTLWIAQVREGNPNAGSAVFNFNGGTLEPTGSATNFFQGVQNAYVQSGGAIIDTTNFNITIAQNLQGGSPSGGLTKLGSGTLTLLGNDSYTGNTLVSNGTLVVTTGSLTGGGAVAVADGAALTVTNVGGSMAVSSLTMGVASASTLHFDFPNGDPGAPAITAGTVAANGSVAINVTGTGLAIGTFPLITFTSGVGLNNFHLGTVQPGISASLVTTATALELNISQVVKSLQWSSSPVNNEWDTSSLNWVDLATYNTTNYAQSLGIGDAVTFDSSGTTTVDIPIAVTPLSVNVDANAPSYTFSGIGKISGIASLTMNSYFALTMETTNDYSGGTTINGAPVYIGNNQALGSGPVTMVYGELASDGGSARTVSNTVVQTADLGVYFGDMVNTGTVTLAGNLDLGGGTTRTLNFNSDVVISGSLTNGGLTTKTGPGSMTITGTSSQNALASQEQGDVIINGGQFTSGDGWRLENITPSSLMQLVVTNGGVFNVGVAFNTANLRVGLTGGDDSATNVLDISGTVNLTPQGGVNGNSAVSLGESGASDILYLRQGGVLMARSLYGLSPSDDEAHFMGGTMRAIASDPGFIQGLTNAYMEDGGLTIDTTNFSVTASQPLLASGSGGLTKVGTGTLTLTGASTYTGPTIINAGKLAIGVAFASPSAMTVNSGATLAFEQGSPSNTVEISSVTIGGGTNSALEADLAGTNAPAGYITNLTLSGLAAVNMTGPIAIGEFPLFGYGTISGPGGLTIGQVPLGTIATLVTNVTAHTIDLVVSGINSAIWTGTINGNWDTATTNWQVAGTPVAYAQGADVVFNDSASLSAITLTTTLSPNSVAVSNSVLSYLFAGSGSLSGNMNLTKTGTNSLTIGTADTFTGNVLINAGTIVASNATALGSSANPVYVTNNGALDIDGNGLGLEPVTVSGGGFNGTGAIYNSGAAQINAFRNIVLAGDTTFGGLNSIGIRTTNNTDPGLISNGHNIIKVGTNSLVLNGGTTITGLTNVWFTDLGNVDIQQGIVSFERRASMGISNNLITVESGATLAVYSLDQTVPAPANAIVMTNATLEGNGATAGNVNTLAGQITLNGPTNSITTIGGTLLGLHGPIIGAGGAIYNGLITLAGTNTYAGPTAVTGGTVTLANSASMSGTASITIITNSTLNVAAFDSWTLGAGQTLGGAGTVVGNVLADGTLAPGNGTGTLAVNGNVTLAGNLLIEVNKSLAQSNDMAVVSGTLANTGAGTVVVTNLGPGLAVGDTFTLFNQPLVNGNAMTVTGGSATWTNNLAVNGTISVLSITGPVNTNSVPIAFVYSAGNLNLSWPSDHTGWRLQVQTNSLATGLSTNWSTWAGSTGTNAVSIPVNAGNPTLFFRLIYP